MVDLEQTSLSLPMVLFLIFMVLKLCGVIAWSWWWVTAPLWIPFALFGIAIIIWAIWFLAKSEVKG